jgi:hypothetical protein
MLPDGSAQQLYWLHGIGRIAMELKVNKERYNPVEHTYSRIGLGFKSFLHLAVKFQLVSYVELRVSKLREENEQQLPAILSSLLHVASFEYTTTAQLNLPRKSSCYHSHPNAELITLLLDLGADPCTLWMPMLQRHRTNLEVLKTFILHSTNIQLPDIEIIQTFNLDTETSQILDRRLKDTSMNNIEIAELHREEEDFRLTAAGRKSPDRKKRRKYLSLLSHILPHRKRSDQM